MSDRQLEEALAAFLGSRRKAQALLARTTLQHLAEAPLAELERFMPGDVARRFAAALVLARRILSPPPRNALSGPEEAFAHLHPYLAGREAERFVVVAVDSRLQVLATVVISEGTPAEVSVSPADVFAVALRHRAYGVVLAHNHPSGNAKPTAEDRELTRRLAEAGKIVGVPVIDHLVVCGESFTSLAEGTERSVRIVRSTRS